MRKILILGANGFIGVGLVAVLLQDQDIEIHALDLTDNRLRELNLLQHPRLHFKQGDMLKETAWLDSKISECDVVIPLVAIATPATYVTDPLKVFELDFEANLRVVKECVKQHKRIIFPSTSEVYGMSSDPVFDEEKSTLAQGPINKQRWIYSCIKQMLDRVIYAHGQRDNLQFTLFRPFNWIGPMQDDLNSKARVVSIFLGNITRGEDLVLVDGGTQRRCFTYIDDGIDALVKIIANKDGVADGRIFNIGNPHNDYSIRDLAEKMLLQAKQYPKWSEMVNKVNIIVQDADKFYGSGYQDLQHRVPSIKNAQTYLGWEPKYSLDEAIKLIEDYFLLQQLPP